MSSEVMFKAALGGFKRTEVINYIEKLQNDFFKYRKANEENVRELSDRITQLEDELEQLRDVNAADRVADEPKISAVSDIKAVIDGLAENMNKLFEQMLAAASGQDSEVQQENELSVEQELTDEQPESEDGESDIAEENQPEPDTAESAQEESHGHSHRYADDDDEQSFNEQIKKLISEYGTL